MRLPRRRRRSGDESILFLGGFHSQAQLSILMVAVDPAPQYAFLYAFALVFRVT